MLANATRICEAKFGTLFLCEGRVHFASSRCTACRPHLPRLRQRIRPFRPQPDSRAWLASPRPKQVVHIADCRTEPAYLEGDPAARRHRSMLGGAQDSARRADAQGERADRRDRHLPPGGAPVHRQADRAGAELRRPGRDRDREHAAAQRAARIAAAADRHRRRAQGHQPLDLRSADGARNACCSPPLGFATPIKATITRNARATLSIAQSRYGFPAEFIEYVKDRPGRAGARHRHGSRPAGGQGHSYSRRTGRSGLHLDRGAEAWRLPHHSRRPNAARGHPDRRH